MPEQKNQLAALPGYGMLAVALTLLYGVASVRKEGEKKPKPDASPPPIMTTSGFRRADSHRTFLTEKGIIEKGTSSKLTSGAKVLILTLPDPIASQFGYWYDQSIDALTRAMGDQGESDNPLHGYALTDRWFPWTIASEDKTKNLMTRTADSEKEPGVVIYSKNCDANDRYVVLVVGENPTTGLRVKALEAALELGAVAKGGKDVPISLIGPFFTGSQASLGRAILEWSERREKKKEAHVGVKCISGTALGLKPWTKMLPSSQAAQLCALCGPITGTHVPFDHLNQAALHYLSKRGRSTPADRLDGHPDGKVAYLVEANSGFGEAAAGSASIKTNGPHLIFRFPMHIGRLAGIRSKEERERDEQLGLIKPGEDQLVALDENRSGGDLVPAADETRTALINKRLLADYWSALRGERVRYVCVVATDPRDVLFLLEQIQTACPDAQPVAFGADLHYVHPDYLRFMRGVMIVGNYPLYQPAQPWQAANPDDRRRMPFPSCYAEGLYNAVLATLNQRELMADYLAPKFGDTDSQKPPIWVTAVGENGEFVPLAYFTNYRDDGYLVDAVDPRTDATTPDSPFTRRFLYLVGLVLVAGLLGVWGIWQMERGTPAAAAHASAAHPSAAEEAARVWAPGLRAQFVLLAGIGGGFATLPLILAFWSAYPSHDARAEKILFVLVTLLLVLITAATCWSVLRQGCLTVTGLNHLRRRRLPYALLDPWQTVAFALLLSGVVFGWLLTDHARLQQAACILFAERSGNLFSGCSPVVPAAVIALGLIVYAFLGLELTRLMTEFRVDTPYPDWGKGGKDAPEDMSKQRMTIEAVCRARETATEIDSQFYSVAGTFSEPAQGMSTWWVRLLVGGTVGGFSVALILLAAQRQPNQGWTLYCLGLPLILASMLLCAGVLGFVWYHDRKATLGQPRPTAWLALVLTGAACALALHRAQRTWESQAWNCLFATGLLALVFLTLLASYRLYLLWKQVETMIRAITAIPMLGAFDLFPPKVSKVFGAYLLSARRRALDLAIPLHLLQQLREALCQPHVCDDPHARAALAALDAYTPPSIRNPDELHGREVNALCRVAGELVSALAPGWSNRPVGEAFGTVVTEAGAENERSPEWRGLEEQFVAIMAVVFLSQFLTRMRYHAYMAVTASAALLIAITAYQFEPEQYLMYSAVGIAGAVICLVLWVLYRMNRNELVSRVTRTTPDKFQLDAAFVQNVTVFVLPLLIVVVTQLAGRMRSVVEPVLSWLR